MSEKSMTYTGGSTREAVRLTVGTLVDTTGLHGWRTSYELTLRNLSGARRESRERTVDCAFSTKAEADRARRVFSADVLSATPGTFSYDGVSARGYVTGFDISSQLIPIRGQLTVVVLEDVWRTERTYPFEMGYSGDSEWLNYPHGYPYDFGPPPPEQGVDVPGYGAHPVRLTVYGPASNPYVIIAGNRYQVDVNVPSGGYLVVDGVSKTVEVVTQGGERTSAFDKALRGSGEGSGEYAFERVPSGYSAVSWPNSFGFDLTVYDEDGEPPWTS